MALASPGHDPWIVLLVNDPRVAMLGAQSLRGVERRIDGPFALWDGKAGAVPVSIVATEPGGPGAWFAATKLAVRRFSPTLVAGIVPIHWCLRAPAPPVFFSSDVVDLEALRPILSQVEVTAGESLPRRVLDDLGSLSPSFFRWQSGPPVQWDAPACPPESRAPKESSGSANQFAVENPRGLEKSSVGKSPSTGRLGCWGPGAFESRAVARWIAETFEVRGIDGESAGLAEAASECGVPWMIAGPCLAIDDPLLRASAPRAGVFPSRTGIHESALVSVLSRFLTILAVPEPLTP